MKHRNYLRVIIMLALIGQLTWLAGCSKSSESVNTQTSSNNDNKSEDWPDENEMQPIDEFAHPGINDKNAEDFAEGGSYSTIEIDKENLFSDRDLEQNPTLSEAEVIAVEDESQYEIKSEGVYVLSGSAKNFSVIVEADSKDKVQIVLKDAKIENDNFPVVYVKSADKCFITAMGENNLSVTGEYVSDDTNNTDAVIFSKDDLTLNGEGSLIIESSYGNGITSKDDMRITGGSYQITCALDAVEANDSIAVYDGDFTIQSKKDAFHCENDDKLGEIYIREGAFKLSAASDGIQATTFLVIDGGSFDINSAEGIEATYVQINDGTISINASDDGINAAKKSTDYEVMIEVNGGDIKVVMGAGDTDGFDSNGSIIINGGTIDVSGKSAFDYDRTATYNGGTIIVNGTKVDEIPSSMMGGQGGGHHGFGNPNDENFNNGEWDDSSKPGKPGKERRPGAFDNQ